MSNFASGRHAKAICDICGVRCEYLDLKEVYRAGNPTNLLACTYCWDKDHPQLFLGRKPIRDPQGLRRARPDTGQADGRSYFDKARFLMPPVSVLNGVVRASTWGVQGGTIQTQIARDPWNAQLANSFTEDFNTGNHRLTKRIIIAPNANITVTVYWKASPNPSEYTAIRMESDDIVTAQYTYVFLWTAGVLAFAGLGSIQGTGTGLGQTVESVGNGWYKVVCTMNLGSNLTHANVFVHARGLVSTDYVASGRVAFYYVEEPIIS